MLQWYKATTSLGFFLHRVQLFECSPFQRAFVCLNSAEAWRGLNTLYHIYTQWNSYVSTWSVAVMIWPLPCMRPPRTRDEWMKMMNAFGPCWVCVCRYVSISSLSFSPEGQFLCASSNTETVHIFKLEQLEAKYAHMRTHTHMHTQNHMRFISNFSTPNSKSLLPGDVSIKGGSFDKLLHTVESQYMKLCRSKVQIINWLHQDYPHPSSVHL